MTQEGAKPRGVQEPRIGRSEAQSKAFLGPPPYPYDGDPLHYDHERRLRVDLGLWHFQVLVLVGAPVFRWYVSRDREEVAWSRDENAWMAYLRRLLKELELEPDLVPPWHYEDPCPDDFEDDEDFAREEELIERLRKEATADVKLAREKISYAETAARLKLTARAFDQVLKSMKDIPGYADANRDLLERIPGVSDGLAGAIVRRDFRASRRTGPKG